jgi:hypothetical protein
VALYKDGKAVWESNRPIKNQIGLEGGITPPEYLAQVPKYEEEPKRDYSRKTIIRWPWLYICRQYGRHFDERETVIELRMPWSLDYGFNSTAWRPRISRAIVIVFGRAHTRLAKGGGHARGALSVWDHGTGDFW